ncbi:MAG TPA: 3-oxoacyl-ACP reductase family protein [Methylomirabilota bacterium]|jgi:NAD(P)-dependent dehydrogenase (short-subunit alcohol dehydrogenase family)|nr:3-oxoacyl-ACP reductase family protein [Methylomirabilota bacterium]
MATTTSQPQAAAGGKPLTGRVALVTGGTRGIGAAICHALAAEGAVVAAGFSSNLGRAEELRHEIEAEGGTASLHQGNIGEAEDCKRVVGDVLKEHGRLDILVNNAGITVDKPVWKLSPDDWDKVLKVDLSGAFYMSKPAIEHMIGRGSGRIINISSVTGEIGNVGQVNYTAAKAGMFGLTKTLAREAALALRLAGKLEKGIGVTVNCVTPGLIETDMIVTIPPFMLAEIIEKVPMHRMGQPEEIARLVTFLADDASGYITGQVWGVNGGLDM